jgi:hypothetical protein
VGFIVNRDFESYGDHWGLRGMSERAAQVGARLSVRSQPGDGTEVVLGGGFGPGSRAGSPTAGIAGSLGGTGAIHWMVYEKIVRLVNGRARWVALASV